jgi:bifunctional NMN adenylyltransferase/nudix hydrolase
MSSQDNFDLAVLIGRFQPFHNGHAALLEKALELAPQVVVVIGSAFVARSAAHPFGWEERAAMIRASLNESLRGRIRFVPVRDYYADAQWGHAVMMQVQAREGQRVAVVGSWQDASSQYLQRFPGWTRVAMAALEGVAAAFIRDAWYASGHPPNQRGSLALLLPPAVLAYLQTCVGQPEFARLCCEHATIGQSRAKWGSGPFITVDALVKAGGNILLIRRGRDPGAGLLALPGGFLDGRERVLQGAIRELREETCVALDDAKLEATLSDVAVFDHPDRSARGRTITHAHFFDLGETMPVAVRGADDAAEAHWVPIADLAAMENEFFEDHFAILNHFLALTS